MLGSSCSISGNFFDHHFVMRFQVLLCAEVELVFQLPGVFDDADKRTVSPSRTVTVAGVKRMAASLISIWTVRLTTGGDTGLANGLGTVASGMTS